MSRRKLPLDIFSLARVLLGGQKNAKVAGRKGLKVARRKTKINNSTERSAEKAKSEGESIVQRFALQQEEAAAGDRESG